MASITDDELEYLSPNFDPTTLTVPRLRAILVAHDVPYPSSAKKAQLVELFEDHVIPQAERLLAARARTKRTSRGITDMPSSREGSLVGDDDDEDRTRARAPPVTPRGRPRKSGKIAAAEDDFDTPAATRTPAATSTVSRRKSTKHYRTSDTENVTDPELQRPVARRSRKSVATPVVKQESPEVWHSPRAEQDVFTDDNPFQSGSSPVYEPVSTRKGRKSVGASKTSPRKSSVSRRRTGHLSPSKDVAQKDGFTAPSSKTFEVPVSRLRGRKQKMEEEELEDLAVDDEGVETGEEFTAEEQLELVRARAKNGEADILPPRRKKPKRKGGVSKSAPWVILLALFGGYAAWWRKEKLDIGYCGVGRDSSAHSDVKIPDWASFLEPQCEPCPPHAFCYPLLETQCEPDFVHKPHPLALGGLVPLPPTCEPDGEKARRVKAVADRAVEELRERRAKWECGDLKDDKGKELPAVEIDEQELKQEVGKKRRRGLSQSEFEDLWAGALGEITSRDEVLSGVDGQSGRLTLTSTSLARLSLSCAVRRSARLALARYRIQLAGLILLASLIWTLRRRFHSHRHATARVPQLVALTLNRLATQAALHAQDPRGVPEPWISVSQLRDDVLRDEFSAARRENLWRRVKPVVEMNANVRAAVREGRGGDVSRVWEWIGSIGAIEDGWANSAKRSQSGNGRYSVGGTGIDPASPGYEYDTSAVLGDESEGNITLNSPPTGRGTGTGTGTGTPTPGENWSSSRWEDGGRPVY